MNLGRDRWIEWVLGEGGIRGHMGMGERTQERAGHYREERSQ